MWLRQNNNYVKNKKEEKEKKKVKQLEYFPQEFFLNHQPTDIREKNAHHI